MPHDGLHRIPYCIVWYGYVEITTVDRVLQNALHVRLEGVTGKK